MSPERRRGGHVQGRKVTIIVAVEPALRRLVEDEADRQQSSISDVARAALREHFGKDPDQEVGS